ncbi:flavin monoamine oxidase family protein [Falsiroseomonas sp. HW251]|uniref:flavin monoamine oxidase family protein n=1 Tax=Falsiroseomonas sp. HW251 TaxID=3390998 RepID=UPI003D32196B
MPELTAFTREAARRIGITETALCKAEQTDRIAREPDGRWDIDKIRRRLVETVDPYRSPLANGMLYEFQMTMFQPVGGMDAIGQALFRALGPELVRLGRKVIEIRQSERGVRVLHVDAAQGGNPIETTADWCVCTIPMTVLSQTEMDVGPAMRAAIDSIPYDASAKVGLQFRRRFWEQDEQIYGGIPYTDLPNSLISYPSRRHVGRQGRAARGLSLRRRLRLPAFGDAAGGLRAPLPGLG